MKKKHPKKNLATHNMNVDAIDHLWRRHFLWCKKNFQRSPKMREYEVFGKAIGEFYGKHPDVVKDVFLVINFDNKWFLRFPGSFGELIPFGEAKYLLDLVILALSKDGASRYQRRKEFEQDVEGGRVITEQSPVIAILGIV